MSRRIAPFAKALDADFQGRFRCEGFCFLAQHDFRSIQEVERLALDDPAEYERLLKGYKNLVETKKPRQPGGLPEPTRHSDDMAEEPPTEFWVEGMLPRGGIMLIAAQKKVGKSTLLANLARSVLLGEPFLGRGCRSGSVLYISTDEHKRTTLSRLDRVGILRHPKLASICHRQFDPQWKVKLRSYIEREGYEFVIIDTLFKIAGLTEIKDPGPWAAAYQALKILTDELGCTVVITAHSKKEGQGTNAVAGSYQVTAEPDSTMVIEKLANGSRYVFTEQREGTDLERTILELDKDAMTVSAGQELWIQRVRETEQEIFSTLGAEPETRDEIGAKVKKRRGLLIEALSSGVDSGWLLRQGRGTRRNPYRYAVNGNGKPNSLVNAVPKDVVVQLGTRGRNPDSVPDHVGDGSEPLEQLGKAGMAGKAGSAGTEGEKEDELWAAAMEKGLFEP